MKWAYSGTKRTLKLLSVGLSPLSRYLYFIKDRYTMDLLKSAYPAYLLLFYPVIFGFQN